MDNQRYIQFINAIIDQTKKSKIHWHYLDSNKDLYEGMHWTETEEKFGLMVPKEIIYPNFNREDSFYTTINGTYIVLFVFRSEPATMYVVPNTYKKVVQLTADQYGEYITRLLNLVQSQFPDGETFIDNLLAKNGEADNNQHG